MMIRAIVVATTALLFAAPVHATPQGAGSAMSDVEYSLDFSGPWTDPDIPSPPPPTPYEPDCDVMESECESGCQSGSKSQDEYDSCVDKCMDRAGC